MTLASRIAVMDHGEIRQIGTPTEIYEFPNSRFVADFIGSINMFEGVVGALVGDWARIDVPALGTPVKVLARADLAPGARVVVAIRPEKIAIGRERPAAANAFAGTVRDLGYFGKDSLYRVSLPSGALVSVNNVNTRRADENGRIAQWEDQVWLSFEPAAAIVFAA